jgi:hypothetical protein
MALKDGKPIPEDVLSAMEKAAQQRGRPYDEATREMLRCKACWVTPIGNSRRPSLKAEDQTGFFVITPCMRHGGPVLPGNTGGSGAA